MNVVLCPVCGKPLEQVRYNRDSMLNESWWDAVKAGDYFCRTCPGNERGKSGFCYWWKWEVDSQVES